MKKFVLNFVAMLLTVTSVSAAAQQEVETRSFWLLVANKTNKKITLYANNAPAPCTELDPGEPDCIAIDICCPTGSSVREHFPLQARYEGSSGRMMELGLALELPALQSNGIMMLVLAHEKMVDAVPQKPKEHYFNADVCAAVLSEVAATNNVARAPSSLGFQRDVIHTEASPEWTLAMGEIFHVITSNFVYDPVIQASYYVEPVIAAEEAVALARRSANDLAVHANAAEEEDGVVVDDPDKDDWVEVHSEDTDE